MNGWIKNLVLNFREGYEKLSELEKRKVGNLDNLAPPLQVEVVTIKNDVVAMQNHLFIFTHFSDEPDLDIRVHEIDSNEAVEKLQEILKEAKWQKKLPEDSGRHIKDESKNVFATVVEGFFINMLRDMRGKVVNSVFGKPKELPAGVHSKTMLTRDSFVWHGFGEIEKLDVVAIVNKIIEEAKNSAKSQPQPTPVSRPPRIKGFGTYFYPAIWIGKKPEPSFEEKVFESRMPLFPKKVFDAEYKGNKIVVNENGFIAIGIDDKTNALRMLNEIMGAALLFKVPFYAIRESELGDAEIDQAKLTIGSVGLSIYASLRTALFEDEWMLKPKLSYISTETREIQQEQLLEIIKNAEILAKDETVSELLVYLLESYTYFQGSEYNQAFIMEWMIIEKFINFLWMKKLNQMDIRGNRKDKLEDYTADQMIESLNLCGVIDKEYSLLMEMKSKRNKFIHEGKRISKGDAQKGFDIVSSIVVNFCESLGLLKK